jgi:hypothetical protein
MGDHFPTPAPPPYRPVPKAWGTPPPPWRACSGASGECGRSCGASRDSPPHPYLLTFTRDAAGWPIGFEPTTLSPPGTRSTAELRPPPQGVPTSGPPHSLFRGERGGPSSSPYRRSAKAAGGNSCLIIGYPPPANREERNARVLLISAQHDIANRIRAAYFAWRFA